MLSARDHIPIAYKRLEFQNVLKKIAKAATKNLSALRLLMIRKLIDDCSRLRGWKGYPNFTSHWQ